MFLPQFCARTSRQSKLVGCYSRTVNPENSSVISWRESLHEVLESFERAETFDESNNLSMAIVCCLEVVQK